MRILNEKTQVHHTVCYGVCGEECFLCCLYSWVIFVATAEVFIKVRINPPELLSF